MSLGLVSWRPKVLSLNDACKTALTLRRKRRRRRRRKRRRRRDGRKFAGAGRGGPQTGERSQERAVNKFGKIRVGQIWATKLGNCDIWSVTNYSVYFKSNQYEYWPNTLFFSLVNYLFHTRNIHSKIGQIVTDFDKFFSIKVHFRRKCRI